jgi:hypothetical protein
MSTEGPARKQLALNADAMPLGLLYNVPGVFTTAQAASPTLPDIMRYSPWR